MDTVSRRYRKLKGWPSKRKRLYASNINRRWEKNKVENSAISMGAESCLSNEDMWMKTGTLKRGASRSEIQTIYSADTKITVDQPDDDYEKVQRCGH
ncbi:hypothetical protein AVEN_111814-1 [Araneus ventricosus]|uniref:Uncharacterized protein n=1 Tax=Araneus ventricosus TaxID=182803 RepID=A0A4Y2JIV2_ARAVE|nr:hypothetical protein AVEN_111814-1 [Araneus ventricosus]